MTDTPTVLEDSGANTIDVLANDTDAESDPLTIRARPDGTHGTVVITGGGTGLTYEPVGGLRRAGLVHLHDRRRARRHRTGTVNVTVTPVNDAPAGTDKTIRSPAPRTSSSHRPTSASPTRPTARRTL